MNYNMQKKYNFTLNDGGIGYNSIGYRFTVNLFEVIKFSDTVKSISARLAVKERIRFLDYMSHVAFFNHDEFLRLEDFDIKQYALFEFLEKVNLIDAIAQIEAFLYVTDNINMLDKIAELNALVSTNENFHIEEISDIHAFQTKLESFGISDYNEIFALIEQYESAVLLDKDPRKAISDFVIGHDNYLDTAFDYIIPFDMMIDWKTSSIQIMPQTESSYIEMQGVDGSIAENTIYKNRLFNIVAYSQDGLTIQEKEELKKDIVRILDSTKKEPKQMTFQTADIAFDVKYSGAAEISEGPSFVKISVPFEATPYGHPLFDQEVFGSGLLINNGLIETGCINKISSGCVNPSFQMGTIHYSWAGTVPENNTLVIDHESYMCYLETPYGEKINAITQLTGDFQKIPKESSVAITASEHTEAFLFTTIRERILW